MSTLDLDLFDGEILVFRRNENLLLKKSIHIESILSRHSMVFCLGCLEYLWAQRTRVWGSTAARRDDRYPEPADTQCRRPSVPVLAPGGEKAMEVSPFGTTNDHDRHKPVEAEVRYSCLPLTAFRIVNVSRRT
jgi:hypothetical protein